MSGPLTGVRVIELAGIGPAPFATMVLADLGADVIRVDRVGSAGPTSDAAAYNVLNRNRPVIFVDLKDPAGVDLVLAMVEQADVVIEGFRPGVAARLGVGPDACRERNPRVVYGHMTGWGQEGPLADRAGHDITYASIAGALGHIGRRGQPPTPPLNLVADFGGGGMLMVAGVLAALVERATSGRGQTVDAAMVDGVALLMAPFFGARAMGVWNDERGTNMLDSGAPYYDCYECADGGWIAVGAIEPQFYAALLDGLDLDPSELPEQNDRSRWDELRTAIGTKFVTRSRDDWADHFAATDACVAPILSLPETAAHAHISARQTVIDVDGAPHPAPAPRFDRSTTSRPRPGNSLTGDAAATHLQAWNVPDAIVHAARDAHALG